MRYIDMRTRVNPHEDETFIFDLTVIEITKHTKNCVMRFARAERIPRVGVLRAITNLSLAHAVAIVKHWESELPQVMTLPQGDPEVE